MVHGGSAWECVWKKMIKRIEPMRDREVGTIRMNTVHWTHWTSGCACVCFMPCFPLQFTFSSTE